LSGGFRFLSRSTLARDVAGRNRSRLPYPYLFGRLHGGRGRLLSFLQLPESLHVFHADAGAGQQLPADVHWLVRRRPGFLSLDRILFPARLRRRGGQESLHREPDRRFRLPDRIIPVDQTLWLAELRTII